MNWFSNHFGKIWLAILALMAAGWVSNIIKLVELWRSPVSGWHDLGSCSWDFVFPVGSVLGYF